MRGLARATAILLTLGVACGGGVSRESVASCLKESEAGPKIAGWDVVTEGNLPKVSGVRGIGVGGQFGLFGSIEPGSFPAAVFVFESEEEAVPAEASLEFSFHSPDGDVTRRGSVVVVYSPPPEDDFRSAVEACVG
jgi:hypothetical protein